MILFLKKHIPQEYKDVGEILSAYLQQYGGFRAVLRSAYFAFAIFVLFLTFGIWTSPGWWDLPIDILPSLISFTLAGYALFLGFGDEKFRGHLAGGKNEPSPLLDISSTFAHFIVVQVIALVFAIVADSRPIRTLFELFNITSFDQGPVHIIRMAIGYGFWALSFLVFLYSISCIIAITMSLFRVTRWLNTHHAEQKETTDTQ